MNYTAKARYILFKDNNGDEYLCPLDAVKKRSDLPQEKFEECVERDVVGRYSGNIEIDNA